MNGSSKGTLRYDRAKTATCGLCGDHEIVTPEWRVTYAQEARRLGWIYTRINGWICPRCVKRQTTEGGG
ncbi:hypothetical protein [Deinococcus sp. 12RED42]|uniref:hypothetical protein n=1 Tax=Deinococcus sp. 12RED42 TaxID=2745872 RepID=UPI001E3D8FBB|nr:hypothetical protein [Deinococcus sp. 12RED42]MCD0167110.1 hypothetical protein [Deinococcus sp. 12RED42]